jgi:hypothetical protein
METAMTAMARIAVAFLPVLLAAHPVKASFLALYGAALGLDEARVRRLAAGDARITFLDHDWRLNRVP